MRPSSRPSSCGWSTGVHQGSVPPRPSILGSRSRLFSVFASVHGRIPGQLLLDFQLVCSSRFFSRPSILMVFSTIRTVGKGKALYAFLAGALCVAAYGFFQYADAIDANGILPRRAGSIETFPASPPPHVFDFWRDRTFWALTF